MEFLFLASKTQLYICMYAWPVCPQNLISPLSYNSLWQLNTAYDSLLMTAYMQFYKVLRYPVWAAHKNFAVLV